MRKIRIITDSASDMTLDTLKKHDVKLVSMTLAIGNDFFVDDKKTAMSEFWRLMETEVLKTSQPSPESFLKEFEQAKENDEIAICICVASALSGTYQSAVLAKSLAEYDDIYVIDSNTAAIAQEILVLKACELRDQNMDAKDIVDYLESYKKRIRIFAGMDTLEYLARGGRIPPSLSKFGNAMKIKPVITVNEEGKVGVVKVARGVKKAMGGVVDIISKHPIDLDEPIIPIFSKDEGNCIQLLEELKKAGYDVDYLPNEEIGCTIGCHIGPSAYGITYVEKQ